MQPTQRRSMNQHIVPVRLRFVPDGNQGFDASQRSSVVAIAVERFVGDRRRRLCSGLPATTTAGSR